MTLKIVFSKKVPSFSDKEPRHLESRKKFATNNIHDIINVERTERGEPGSQRAL